MASEIKAPPSKVITVAGRRLTVHKRTFELSLKRYALMESAEKSLNGDGAKDVQDSLAEMLRRNFVLSTYPSLAACTTGKIFSQEECLQIDEDDLVLWLETAKELNPVWFPSQTAAPEEEQEKKESEG